MMASKVFDAIACGVTLTPPTPGPATAEIGDWKAPSGGGSVSEPAGLWPQATKAIPAVTIASAVCFIPTSYDSASNLARGRGDGNGQQVPCISPPPPHETRDLCAGCRGRFPTRQGVRIPAHGPRPGSDAEPHPLRHLRGRPHHGRTATARRAGRAAGAALPGPRRSPGEAGDAGQPRGPAR